MHIDKSPVMEEAVNGKRDLTAHTEDSGKQVGAGTQIRLFAQIFQCMPFFLQRIIRRGGSLYLNGNRLDFKGLLHFRSQFHSSAHDHRRTDIVFCDFIVVCNLLAFKNNLRAFETTSVVQIDEPERLAVADASCPSAQYHFLASVCLHIGIQMCDQFSFHMSST